MRQALFRLIFLAAAAWLLAADVADAQRSTRVLNFSDLRGWATDNHAEALAVFRTSCNRIQTSDPVQLSEWRQVCAAAQTAGSARLFFEQRFAPIMVWDGAAPLLTAYYEPEFAGARQRSDVYRFPLYAPPPELPPRGIWLSRQEIEARRVLADRGLELVWLSDPVEALYVHIQGSARIRLDDGTVMRIGFAGRNGHAYRSVARELIRLRLLAAGEATLQGMKRWARRNPAMAQQALWHNPSFIFFQELQLNDFEGPRGALQVPLTAMRSLAVDPDYVVLGAPVFVMMDGGANSVNRLMVAQDTGAMIKGAQRGDLFVGTGEAAGDWAMRISYPGRLVMLVPRPIATRLAAASAN